MTLPLPKNFLHKEPIVPNGAMKLDLYQWKGKNTAVSARQSVGEFRSAAQSGW
jgi:hypothetical protein